MLSGHGSEHSKARGTYLDRARGVRKRRRRRKR